MAITCEWKKPLATAVNKHGENVTFYGGGNCITCICFNNKILENFIIDKEHFKRCEYNGTEYQDIIVYRDRKQESKKLIELLVLGNFEFTVKNTKGDNNND